MYVKRLNKDGTRKPMEEYSFVLGRAAALLKFKRRGNTLVEMLEGDAVTKLFFDQERYFKHGPPSDADRHEFESEFRAAMEAIVSHLRCVAPAARFVMAQRHGFSPVSGCEKLSFRGYVVGLRIVYHCIPAFIESLPELATLLEFFDTEVYKSGEQLICGINGRKSTKDPRVLVPLDRVEGGTIEDYVLQETEPHWFLCSSRTDDDAGDDNGDDEHDGAELPLQDPEDRVERLVACLGPTTAAAYGSWIRVGMVLKSLGGGGDAYLPAFLRFSRLGGSSYVSDEDCARKWGTFRAASSASSSSTSSRRPLTIATVCKYAKRDDIVAFREWQATERASERAASNEGASNLMAVASSWDCSRVVSAATLAIHADAEAVSDARVEGGRVLFKCDGIERTVDLATLCIEPGRKFMQAEYSALSCGSVLLPNTTVPATGWSVSRPCETVRLKNDGPPRTFLDLDMVGNNVVRAVTSYPDTGKTLALKGGQAMLDMLGGVVRNAIGQHLQGALGVPTHVVNNVVFNGNVTVGVGEDGAAGEFDAMSGALLLHASERRLRKAGGMVYERVPDCPCAYRPLSTYEAFINVVLKNDAIYRANPRRFDDMMKFLTNYTELDELPELRPDRNLLSFSNGVLRLDDLAFTPYTDLDVAVPLVARHHIAAPYTGHADTPLLDIVLDAQFGDDEEGHEVAELLMAFIGRLLFPIGSKDRWQAMPYLVGVGGTGKSLILSVADSMFRKGTVGNLGGKREDVFGMANLVDKDAVFGRDMPAKLSGALSQELMQAMVSGEAMEIPRKGMVALNVDWTAPVIMGSNHMPDYVNTGNNVGRRIVIFRFPNTIQDPREDLLDCIRETEMPDVVCRALTAYHAAVERAKAAGGFWKSVPAKVLEWRGGLAAATNKLHEFLAMDDDERGFTIRRVEGRVTWALDLEAAFFKCERFTDYSFMFDVAVLAAFGFTTSGDKYEYVCKSCKQLAKSRGGKCCADYNNSSRAKKRVVFDMVIEPI